MHTTLIDVHALNRHHQDPDWRVIDARFSLGRRGPWRPGIRRRPRARRPCMLTWTRTSPDPLSAVKRGRHPIANGGPGRRVILTVRDRRKRPGRGLRRCGRFGGRPGMVDAPLAGARRRRGVGRRLAGPWTGAGLPVTRDMPEVAARTFVPSVRAHLVTDVDGVEPIQERCGLDRPGRPHAGAVPR